MDVGDQKNKLAMEEEETKLKALSSHSDVAMKKATTTMTEAKTGVSFPVKLQDRMLLNAVGVRKKSVLGLGIKIYAFGIYADNEKLKELLSRSKVVENAVAGGHEKPSKAMYDLVINSDVEMMVRLVIVFRGLTMSLVRKNFDEGLGASLKKFTGGQNNQQLVNNDDIKLSSGSVIEITRLPGFILQTKVKDEIVSEVESELLCRAYFDMYIGDEPLDKEARDRFGKSMLSLF